MVCDFERENHKSDICVWDFCVYVCDRVWICVCVCDFGPKNHQWKFVVLILGLAEGMRPAKAQWGKFGVKNLFNKRAGFGFLGQTRRFGLSMKKPGPNPTRCHSYIFFIKTIKKINQTTNKLKIKKKKKKKKNNNNNNNNKKYEITRIEEENVDHGKDPHILLIALIVMLF